MVFIKDIAVPLLVAAITVGALNYIIIKFLRFIGLDITILKIIIFFIIWYYVGPFLYEILVNNIIVYENEGISFIYTPVQTIVRMLGL